MDLAWSSIAALTVAPLQDLLNLGAESRMNIPGRAGRELALAMSGRHRFVPGFSVVAGTNRAVEARGTGED